MNDEKQTIKKITLPLSVQQKLSETRTQVTEAKPETKPAHSVKENEETQKTGVTTIDSSDEVQDENLKLRTRSQKYAAAVYRKVKDVESTKKGDSFRKKYGGMAHKLPVLIRTAGLAQALAFVEGKSEAGWTRLVEDLNAVVGKTNGKDLLQASLSEDLFSYMHLTRKTMDALVWFKRFAESVLNVKQGEEDTDKVDEKAEEQPTNVEGT